MNISITQLVVLTTTLLIASGCDSSSDDSSMPMTNTDAGSTDMTRMEGVDMGTEPQTPEDLDEGEPQPYEYPSSLDTATEPAYEIEDCAANKLSRVRGWIVDRIGRPITGARAQLCVTNVSGTLVCLMPAQSNTDGTYTLDVPRTESCASRAVLRVIKTGAPRATMYCALDLTEASDTGEIILREPSVAYATIGASTKPAFEPALSSRDVTFPSGITMTVVPDDLFGIEPESDYEMLSTRHILPDERGLCFLDETNTPDHLFAFAPELAVLGEGAGISFENQFDYEAGQTLELWLLGGLDCTIDGEHVKEGEWKQVGTAQVSSGGDRIETEFKLPCLTWIGLRANN